MVRRQHPSRTACVRRPNAAALTLIELLVVMAIITIIVSSITVAAYSIFKLSQKKATRNFFETIAVALEQYKQEYRMYVPAEDENGPLDTPNDSTYVLWQALEYEGGYRFHPESKHKEIGTTFTDPASDTQIRRYLYIDSWKTRVYYECDRPYTQYRLRSRGPDLEADTGDDIEKE